MLHKLGWWLVRFLLKPGEKLERDRIGRSNMGPLMILPRVINWKLMSHDAVRAFHCGEYTYLFYGDVEEWDAMGFTKHLCNKSIDAKTGL